MTDINNSRRGFLRNAFAMAAAGAAAGAPSFAAAKEVIQMPAKWDEETDVIVVGSGFAGLAAAIEAAAAGASVMVLEKMPTIGGNSIINGGDICVVGGPHQIKGKIEGDSEDLLEDDIMRNGAYMNEPERAHLVAHSSLTNYEWLVNTIGVEFADGIGFTGGHSKPRCVSAKNGSGSGYVLKEAEYLEKHYGVKPRTRVYVEHILRNPETGVVEGLQVRTRYRFPKADSGTVKTIRARKAVILCHGGFGADVKYRSTLDPKLTAKFQTTNQPGATSELWREASRIGGHIVQADWIQCTPWNNPMEKGMGICWNYSQYVGGEAGLWVNTDGRRFVNELENRKVRSDAILVEQGKGRRCIAVANEASWKVFDERRPDYKKSVTEPGLVKKYATLAELAADWKIDPKALQQQIDEFNGYVKAGKDAQFNRIFTDTVKPMTEGPWYAAEMSPKVHHCMGGLHVTLDGKVLDVETDEPIPHLYAAGEACYGTHGAVRMGDNGTLDALVTGRLAGKAAAQEKA
ncbi:flavocytochrome c [Sutterella sp.]|uniref:flavocytochrome c n=1 Tax=Sutterella sp. TaxID=1981025 RepID=UPI0026E06779|nr:flavocytochrome c [Sutterella sp.]MDO5531686.1 flavocytochrome c [Sutterella sp.]